MNPLEVFMRHVSEGMHGEPDKWPALMPLALAILSRIEEVLPPEVADYFLELFSHPVPEPPVDDDPGF